jgi:hypothetical protein
VTADAGRTAAQQGDEPAEANQAIRASQVIAGCSTNVVSIVMALTRAKYLVLCVTTAACGVSSGEPLTFEVPAEFHGRVLVEYGVASCPYPETRLSRRVIRISGQGRGCSRGDTADSWAKWQFVYSGEGGRISGAPDDDRGLSRQVTVAFVWSGMGWTCEDLGRQVLSFFVGTVAQHDEYKLAWGRDDSSCRPTPWS